ncbi:MAG TPA: DUF4365 domain-containing protein [Tepidisphaeraceae bacterium]|jgi:hypothetical protein
MPVRKRRNQQHLMEDRSIAMLRESLPAEWVLHEYKPDYGIDFVVEVFQFLKDEPTVAETLGETFFVQLKSVAKTTIVTDRVYKRYNVEKRKLEHDKKEFLDIEIIKFDIEVAELLTVRAMGVGMPVLLVIACLDLGRLFYVCLNDLIDKVIEPEDATYADQGTKRISIPLKNELKRDQTSLVPIRFYAKRGKLLAAFTKFEFQRSELAYGLGELSPEHWLVMALHFLSKLKALDIWEGCEMWQLVPFYRCEIDRVEALLKDDSKPVEDRVFYSRPLWQGLVAMGHTFEELCREWNLPTHLAQFLSYPDSPNRPAAVASDPRKAGAAPGGLRRGQLLTRDSAEKPSN